MNLQSLPCYCATLRQAARAVTALYEEVLAESGLHASQYTLLQLLKAAPSLTTTELATMMGMDQTTATRTLALIKKGGLAVDAPGRDRRERHWALTGAGETAFRKWKPAWEAAQAEFERRVGRNEAATLKSSSFLVASKLAADLPPEGSRHEAAQKTKRRRS